MTSTLGTIKGQLVLDVRQAINAYTQARQAHISTVTALSTGGQAMIASGAAIAAPGLAMAAGFIAAVDAAAEFERKLDYFSAVSGASVQDFDDIRDAALRLGADTIYSADQIADSFVELGKAGVDARDIIDGIGEGVANLGAAADMPLEQAAQIMMGAVATFQLGADDAVRVADLLAGAANASLLEVDDLGISMKYAGGIAASLGIPIEDLITSFGILGEAGIRGSTAGTAMRQVLLNLGGATPKATAALRELGIITEDGSNQFYDANGSAKSLADIMEILREATAGMSDEQRLATLRQIFATRSLPSLIALMNSGADGFDEMSDAISRTSAMDVANQRLDNLSGDLEILRGNLETLAIESGGAFQEFARGIIQGITSIIQAFMNLDPSTQQTILTILAIVSVALVLIGTFGMLAGSLMNMIALGIQLRDSWILIRGAYMAFQAALVGGQGVMAAIRAAMVAGTGATVAQTAATGAATTAQTGFNLAMLANPIGIIIAAIVALIGALIWFFTSTELGQEIWANFMSFLQEAWANVSSWAVETWGQLSEFFSTLWTNIVSFFTDAWNNILMVIDYIVNIPQKVQAGWALIGMFFQNLWNRIVTGITTFVNSVITWFQMLPQRIGAFFTALPGMIGFALGFLLGTIVRFFLQIGVWLVTNVPIIVNNVVTFFSELPGKIIAFLVTLWNGFVTWFTTIRDGAITWAVDLITGVVTFFQELPGKITAIVQQMALGLALWLINARERAITIVNDLVQGVIRFFSELPGRVSEFFQDVYNNITDFMTDAWESAIGIAEDIFNGIRDAINGLPGLVSDIFDNVVGAIRDMASRAFNAVRDFAAGLWNGFTSGLGINSPSYIEEAMWQITGVIDDETQRMKSQVRTLQGLGNGISEVGNNLGLGFGDSMDQSLVNLASQMDTAQNLARSMPDSLGVESRQMFALDDMSDALGNLQQQVTYDVDINNPTAEPASESLPRAIRETVFLVG